MVCSRATFIIIIIIIIIIYCLPSHNKMLGFQCRSDREAQNKIL